MCVGEHHVHLGITTPGVLSAVLRRGPTCTPLNPSTPCTAPLTPQPRHPSPLNPSSPCTPLQVPCQPPEGIAVKVDAWRTHNGSWMRIVFSNVAGDGGLSKVSIRPAPTPLRPAPAPAPAPVPSSVPQPQAEAAQAAAATPPATPSGGADSMGWTGMNNTFGGVWEVVGLSPDAPYGYDLQLSDVVGGAVLIR